MTIDFIVANSDVLKLSWLVIMHILKIMPMMHNAQISKNKRRELDLDVTSKVSSTRVGIKLNSPHTSHENPLVFQLFPILYPTLLHLPRLHEEKMITNLRLI